MTAFTEIFADITPLKNCAAVQFFTRLVLAGYAPLKNYISSRSMVFFTGFTSPKDAAVKNGVGNYAVQFFNAAFLTAITPLKNWTGSKNAQFFKGVKLPENQPLKNSAGHYGAQFFNAVKPAVNASLKNYV